MNTPALTDTHVHLWDVENFNYSWLDDFPTLNTTHDLSDYDAATGEADVETIVFVECTESFDDETSRAEVEWVSSLAERDERIRGIVAHASLEKGEEARPHLEWLEEQPLVTGVRRILQDDPNEFCLQPDFVDGVQLLSDFDFSFDVTIHSAQLPATIELVDRCPDVQFVLDHIGKPAIQDGALDPWRDRIEALAQRPNVTCKLSGVLTEADLEAWTQAEVQPYLDHVIDTFGFDRLMFGGDWPVVKLAADYTTWLEVVQTTIQDCSSTEKQKLFRGTAARVYDLT